MNITIAPHSKGGIRSVVEGYENNGFFERHHVTIIWSYEDGGFLLRQYVLLQALIRFIALLIKHQFKADSINLVHCHVAAHGSFFRKALFAMIARAFKKPVIWHLHASQMKVFYDQQGVWGKRFIHMQFERAHTVIVLSEQWRKFISEIAPRARIAVVPNCVNVMSPRNATIKPAPHILSLGVVGERKGSYDLINAFAKVLKVYPEAKLTLAGNGEVAQAQQLVNTLGLQNHVELTGWIDANARKMLLERATIYALPSYNEGLPVSVLEAMGASLPVVTTPVGGLPDLIEHGINGILITPGDITQLSEALMSLITDLKNSIKIANAGYETVKNHYSQEVVMPLLNQIYQSLHNKV